MSAPMSTIKICSGVMLNPSYLHTIWFDSLSKQLQYFEGKVVKTFSSYSYLRKEWSIKVEATMAQAQSWTYLYFRNASNEKTYFYFINKIHYLNETTVELDLELDVMQTYAFDYTLAQSFVEREHQATDNIGDNLLDEGLELGELVHSDDMEIDLGNLCVLLLSTIDPQTATADSDTTYIRASVDDVFCGMGLYMVEEGHFTALASKLAELDSWGKSDCVVNMWMYPRELVKLQVTEEDDKVFKKVQGIQRVDHTYTYKDTITGHTIRNKKLLTYPFNMLYLTNNSGDCAVYHLEQFLNRSPSFYLTGALSAEAGCRIYPNSYKLSGYEAGLSMGNFPTCAWNQDLYKLWVAQNQHQQGLANTTAKITVGAGVATAIGSAAMGNVAGIAGGVATTYHGMNQIASLLAQKRDVDIQPPQAKGVYSGAVNIADNNQKFVFYRKHVDASHAQMIDDYFDMYGYKCNMVKIPNRHVRQNYTYTKTVDCNVYGNLCMEDLTKIKNIFDRGITFWVQGDLIGNYSLSNNCL